MRLRLNILPLIGTLLFLGACHKTADLARENSDFRQPVVDAPTSDAKSDRPTEAGEGLPGYLIDPAKLVIETKDGTTSITGQTGAVRSAKGDFTAAVISLIKLSKTNSVLNKSNVDWKASGTLVASATSSTDGSFRLGSSFGPDDLLFVRVASEATNTIEYKADSVSGSMLWIEAGGAKFIDAAAADQIATQVKNESDASTLAQLVEQVKATGQCRNCNLRGADLSELELPKCDLSFSDLTGAKFVVTNLGECNFTNSNLSQVDFTQANLASANLTQTNITGAIFTGANVNGVIGQQIPAN